MSGPTIALLHGMLQHPRSWAPVLAHAPQAARSRALRLPGHGADPWGLEETSWGAIVARLAEVLPRELDVLVGYSLGARLALALADARPDIPRVIACGPQLSLDEADREARLRWEDELSGVARCEGLEALVDRWEKLAVFADQAGWPEARRAAQRAARLAHDPRGVAWALTTLGTGRMPPLDDVVAAHAARVTLVTGARDAKFGAIAARAAERWGVRHLRLEDAGHNVVADAPRRLAAELFGASPRGVA